MSHPYWTRTDLYDPEQFHRRYTNESLQFWVSHFIRLGEVATGQRFLDLGCGTGGFGAEVARRTGATVVGLEVGRDLIRFGLQVKPERRGGPLFVRARAERIPIADDRLQCVLMSLVLHQIESKIAALREVLRVTAPHGRLVLRTVDPEVTLNRWFPFRFFPTVAATEAARMLPIPEIRTLCAEAGFSRVSCENVVRRTKVGLEAVESELRLRARPSYRLLTDDEITDGLERMKREAGHTSWTEDKPQVLLVAEK